MTQILVDHPDDWIGIPEDWPNARWETPYAWASELTDALHEDWGRPSDGEDIAFRDLMVSLANSLDPATASRLYASVDGWEGPVYVVAMAVLPSAQTAGLTAAEVAGADDDQTIEAPIVEEFPATDGESGASCVRYFLRQEPDRVVARADFVLHIGDTFVDFFHENGDLVDFERALPRLRALASSARRA